MSSRHADGDGNYETTSLTGSGFEKKGGYASPKEQVPVASLPKVPTGPAPGAEAQSPTSSSQSSSTEDN